MASKDLIDCHQNTKEALLEFIINEKSKQERSKSILLQVFKENQYSSKSSLKELLNKLNSNILVLDSYFVRIFEAQKIVKLEDDSELNLLSLDPQEAIEKMKIKVLENSYQDIGIFCGLGVEIEKIIESFVGNKLEDLKISIKEELRNEFKKEKKQSDKGIGNLNKKISKQSDLINELYKIINDLPVNHQNKNQNNWLWYFTISILFLLVSLSLSTFKYSNSPLIDNEINLSNSSSNSVRLAQDLPHPLVKIESLNISDTPETSGPLAKLDSDQTSNSSNEHLGEMNSDLVKVAYDPKILPNSSVVETSNLIICSQSSKQIYSVDLKTLKANNLNLNYCHGLYTNIFIPTTNSILFYGEFMHKNLLINAFILDADKKITKLIWAQDIFYPSLAYYENYVYAFSLRKAAKYNCLQNKWENCASLEIDIKDYQIPIIGFMGRIETKDYQISSVGFKDHILIVGRTKLISYNIKKDSFQEISSLSLTRNANKLIFSADNRVYIIEFPGRIYQSAINDFMEWEIVATRTIDCNGDLWSYVIRFNEKFYFECISSSSILIEFDPKENELKTISINT